MLLFVVAVATWQHRAILQLLPIFWYHKMLVYYYYKLLRCKKFPVPSLRTYNISDTEAKG